MKDPALAQKEVAKLSRLGYAAYTVSVRIEGKGTWHRIRVGGFKTREAAAATLAKLAKKQIDGIIVRR